MRLTIIPEAADQIAELCRAAQGVETGGLLIGSRDNAGALVWGVSGPGSQVAAHARALQIDTSFMLGVMTGVAVGGVVEILGRWHKHVAPDLRTSDNDRAGAQAFRQLCDTALGTCSTFELVVGTDHDSPIGYGAYLCTVEGLSRVHCHSLSGGDSESAADSPSRPAATSSASIS